MDGAISPEPGGRGVLLLVDDNVFFRQMGRAVLQRAGYTVITAHDGEEALESFLRRRGEIDAVLSDLVMPGGGGLGLCRRIKEHDAQVPIIVMTGWEGKEASAHPEEFGFAAVLKKPFAAEDLVDLVGRVVEEGRRRRVAQL